MVKRVYFKNLYELIKVFSFSMSVQKGQRFTNTKYVSGQNTRGGLIRDAQHLYGLSHMPA